MKILHISLTPQGDRYVSLRYFWDNPSEYQEHRLSLTEIEEITKTADTDYYTRIPVDYKTTGQVLYNWLDTNDRILANALQQNQEGMVLAIATSENLAHIPWELLHDGQEFLVCKRPPIIPVRWIWINNNQPIQVVNHPQNRPLNVLFMATSPRGVTPELDYEKEEGQILEATKRCPIDLRVEESGWLTELGYVINEYESHYFDIFHLTGHATYDDDNPYFLTEDEYGNRVDSTADALCSALGFNVPSLIFLSGCRTGYSNRNAVPSMAEQLLERGAKTVIGWGDNVRDTDAAETASKLYGELAQGKTLIQALSLTYRALIQRNIPDWHKLRLYTSMSLLGSLVTPLRTRGRKQLPKTTTTIEFRDDENRLRVARREDFVGRRRQLQNCLRTLKTDFDKVGVLIYGMGGWGKSSIASRLWDRLADSEKILWWRQIDEAYLINKLKKKLIKPSQLDLVSYLENPSIPLTNRLTYVFEQLAESGEKPLLFILDDFEWNLEPREGHYLLKPSVVPIVEALVTAIVETGTTHRIIITCRYEFKSDLLNYFYKQGLEPLRKSELTKKLNRLEKLNSDKISEEIRKRALSLADGNPRLLEFLNDEVLGKNNVETRLTELEQNPEQWKDRIIWDELYQLIDEPLQKVLSHCLIYQIPVPMSALEEVCDSFSDYRQQLQRGKELGLIEISSEDEVYKVSQLLPHIISPIQLPEAPKVYLLHQKAHEKLEELWNYKDNKNQEKWSEIFRLLFADKTNDERFREGFSKMLSVQYNSEVDRAFEGELRRVKGDLSSFNFYERLEHYLGQGEWRKADEETAFLFYVVMVQQGFDDWYNLYRAFPSDILDKIDRLWVEHSQGRFGFSVQKRIYEEVGATLNNDYKTRKKFAEQVEWYLEGRWRSYNSLSFSSDSVKGNLPALLSTKDLHFKGWVSGDLINDRLRELEWWRGLMVDMNGEGFRMCLFPRIET